MTTYLKVQCAKPVKIYWAMLHIVPVNVLAEVSTRCKMTVVCFSFARRSSFGHHQGWKGWEFHTPHLQEMKVFKNL